jgi:putative cofactor-binding repeat protein
MRRLVGVTVLTCLLGFAAPAGAQLSPCTVVVPRLPGAAQAAVAAGGTVCLRGVYEGGLTIRRSDVTLRSAPGARAVLRGQLRIDDGADRVTVTGLELDGTNPDGRPSPLVNGDDATFTANDVHSDVDSCFVLGDPVWGVADRTRIAGNLIHDCGVANTNMDHGVYVRHAVGTVITGNVIRDNPDRGVQLFPNADRSVVRGNLITANGEGVIFSGDGAYASEGNLVERNIISASRLRHDVESWWTTRIGTGNQLRRNCVFGGRRGAIQSPAVGFRARANVLEQSSCRLRAPVLDLPHG